MRIDRTGMGRRQVLTGIGVGIAALVAGCSSRDNVSESKSGSTSASVTQSSASAGSGDSDGSTAECDAIPEETAGPYPGDGSNGPDVLSQNGVVRSDIRSSFGASTTTAEGVPLQINLDLSDVSTCGPLAGAAVYAWHCDREGRYSMYSSGLENENYLRGVGVADDQGRVTFQSIYPGCYSGRWPHIHFEVYDSVESATGGGAIRATSQIALPEQISRSVYEQTGYSQSIQNLNQITLNSDNVFGEDSGVTQMGTVTGTVESGLSVVVDVGVNKENTSDSTSSAPGGPGGLGGPGGPGDRPQGGQPPS